jgi:ATP-binding cassette, subfamily B, bacterial
VLSVTTNGTEDCEESVLVTSSSRHLVGGGSPQPDRPSQSVLQPRADECDQVTDLGAAASVSEVPIWRQFRLFLGDSPSLVAILVVTSVMAGFCESAVLALLAELATALVNEQSSVAMTVGPMHLDSSVNSLLLGGVLIAVLRIALQWLLSYLPARISADVQASMRERLFGAFTRASWSVVAADGEGKFQELVTSQVLQATQAVIQATSALTNGVMLLVLVVSALVVEPITALVVIGAGAILAILIRPLNRLGTRHSRNMSNAQVEYATGIYDAVSVAEEARVFGVGEAQQHQISDLVDAARQRFLTTQLLGRLISGGYQSLVMLLLLVGVGVLKTTGGGSQVASLGAVVLLLVRASTYGQQVQGNYHYMHQSKPFLDLLCEAEERYLDSSPVRGTCSLETVPSIAFEEVSYAYTPMKPVLRKVSFQVKPGEVIGVVGPTGAGKSTLVQVLLGLRQPQSGLYLVDDKLADSASQSAWTRRVAYVPQEPRLLHGTVADNIRFLRDLDDEAVERAARQAHIHDEIMSWQHEYETIISQRANAVSGGQRQRLCLARALAGEPYLLVLDEPTSALDPRSESLVQESLAALKGRLTLFVIAHRFSTLNVCDRVMVLRNGRLEAFATASELIKSNEFYQNARSLSYANALEAPTS